MLNNFNPLRNQPPGEIHKLLYGVATNTNKRICFLNDNTGIYYNSLRKLENVEACFEDAKYYNFYIMLRDDIYLSKTVFTELNKGYNFKLLDHFEERLYSETNPVSKFLTLA